MNNKTTLLIIVLAFALLIGGASILYNGLGQEQTPDQLVVLPTKPIIPSVFIFFFFSDSCFFRAILHSLQS